MPTTPQFAKRAVLLAVTAALYPTISHAEGAGQIAFMAGNVSAIAAGGQPRALKKGSEINVGDTLVTSDNARAQVRFSDGGYISLQPNTRFRIDEYRYTGKEDGSEKSFFSLVKGGLRAITGIIGKNNKSNYQVTTPVATIGIRGTHYTARFCENDCVVGGRRMTNGLYTSVGEGQIFMANALGRLNLDQGQKGFVRDRDSAPKPTDQPPPLTAPQELRRRILAGQDKEDKGFIAGDEVNESGLAVNLRKVTRTLALKGTVVSDVGSPPGLVNGTINGLGELLRYDDGSVGVIGLGTAHLAPESRSDGQYIAWGRWVEGTTAGTVLPLTNNQSLHYVITGSPTPAAFLNGGPQTLTYNLLGATHATSTTGGGGALTDGVTGGILRLHLNAPVAGPTVDLVNVTVRFGTNQYAMNQLGGAVTAATASFALTPTVSGCTSACAATVNGLFAGNQAQRAGFTYTLTDTGANTTIHGAAAFGRP